MNDSWHGLYRDSWNGEIVPETFSHPAKFAPALIRHIYDHAAAEGWLKAGDSVVDPFGGVALGGLHAMRHGLTWCGVELESRFVALAELNIARWNRKYGRMPRWGTARIVQGDSRRLAEVIGETVGATISSPPFGECHNLVGVEGNSRQVTKERVKTEISYGSTPGQLGQSTGDTFWSASLTILEQVHAVLRPGGHAIWVLKAFVKGGKIVDFPGQWQALCESVGFRTVHVHRAWLVEDHGTQAGNFGTEKRHRTERKSFFRRLAESKGSPRIDFEVVLCTQR